MIKNPVEASPPGLPQPSIERRAGHISDPVYKLRYLRKHAKLAPPMERRPKRRHRRAVWAVGPALLLAALAMWMVPAFKTAPTVKAAPVRRPAPQSPAANIWMVEQTQDAEFYSNGLRIERRYSTASDKRTYRVFARNGGTSPDPETRTVPVGIVFHASESDLAPFEPNHAAAVRRQALGLLGWVQSKKLYNYVVDRIGRVYRIVNEEERADHAGNSIWADDRWIYVNLNNSFLGVSFEARTGTALEPAQLHAGRVLVDMLRARYGIAAENCVTHAQVSVNPGNFRVGYHTDWIASFPFRDLGLNDNYDRPLASLCLFGFSYDPVYLESAAAPLRASVLRGEEQVQREADKLNLPFATHRKTLRARYKQLRAAVMPPN